MRHGLLLAAAVDARRSLASTLHALEAAENAKVCFCAFTVNSGNFANCETVATGLTHGLQHQERKNKQAVAANGCSLWDMGRLGYSTLMKPERCVTGWRTWKWADQCWTDAGPVRLLVGLGQT
jgi:hypothetical protein